ncbi:hypothetical protein BpHYR1_053925 [Brachionus plicatilis]|uniref:Uncharacterized protein n=1 Tax=Brachionus plicatilis TaxID=10195 RepID=A0A3M7QCX0_BRAPC|nr:hypothetical protein BpHYR1_053925 [Brachionus plicatilis]
MGSDMSKPRQRRNVSADAFRDQAVKNLVCREVGYGDYGDMYRREPPRYYGRPNEPIRRLPPDPCDPCRTSRCSTPNPCLPVTSNYVDVPADTKYYRPGQYQTLRPNCYKEDFCVEPRQMSIRKPYSPYPYDDCDRLGSKVDCDYIPSDKIYEIRKEKVLIKTDRSQSPPKVRSKSSERYLEVPRSVRILNAESYRPEKVILNPDADSTRSRLRSRSGYTEEVHVRSESSEKHFAENKNFNSSLNKSQICLNNDIIYVPMVREEFIKRESQKLNSESDQGETEWRKRPNKIIIREVEQPGIKSILKNQLDPVNFNYDANINETLADRTLDDNGTINAKTPNGRLSNPSASNELSSNSFANLKFGVAKDGSLLYTYE